MTRTCPALAVALLALSSTAHAQRMEDGRYTFANREVRLELIVTESGRTVSSVTLTRLATGKKTGGQGYLMSASPPAHDVYADWYEFQTPECNYEFDLSGPGNRIELSEYDCQDTTRKARKYLLTLVPAGR